MTIWKLEDRREIRLITPIELKGLPKNTILYDIFGEQAIVGEDEIDLDTRGGYLAYGFLQKVKQ